MECSTPGFPVHHQLLELAQTHVHWVGDAIQLSHPLLSPSLPAFPIIMVFSNESVLHIRRPKYWSFSFSISFSNEYSGLISFRMDWLDLWSLRDFQESSPTPQYKSTNSSALRMRGKRLSSCPPTFLYFDHEFVKMHIMLMGRRALSGTKHKGDSILVSRK